MCPDKQSDRHARALHGMHPDCTEILYTEEQIAKRVRELGARISEDYRGEKIVLVALLRGAAIFMADLARAIDGDVELDFMTASSYGDQACSSGEVRITHDLSTDIADKHVILVEDIIDTGLTLAHISETLRARNPRSLEVAAFLVKAGHPPLAVECRYLGFECPDAFIVGYGLDYAQHYRHLPYIAVLDPQVYQPTIASS